MILYISNISVVIALSRLLRKTLILLLVSSPCWPSSNAYSILHDVIGRGFVVCGVNTDRVGFSAANSLGEYQGFDVDLCRAVASAIFNDPSKVEFISQTTNTRFVALQNRQIDLLVRNTSWTLRRNVQYGQFVATTFYDGQGFMASKNSGIQSVMELDNVPVCLIEGTNSESNAKLYFELKGMQFKPVYTQNRQELLAKYQSGKCKSITTDRSSLAVFRATFGKPHAYLILPEIISKEPLGPVVRHGDSHWENVVRWATNCMINAEEMGVSSENIDQLNVSNRVDIKRLIGQTGALGAVLGIDKKWCANVIRHVGNYGEVYERNVGPSTRLALKRGINHLWVNGGLLHAPPIR